jgi:hypothetical protein
MADDGGEIVAKGNRSAPIGADSSRVRAGDMLFAAHLGNLHDGASLAPSLQARERRRLPCPEDREYGQKPGCRMLLHRPSE